MEMRIRMRMVIMSNEVARQKQLVSVLPQGTTYKGRGEGWGWWSCRMSSQGKNSWWVYCLRVLHTKEEEKDEDGDHVEWARKAKTVGECTASGCYIQRKRRRMRMVIMSNELARQKQLVSVLPQGATYKGRGEGWGWWSCRMSSQGKNSWWVYCLRVLHTKEEEKDEDGDHVERGRKAKTVGECTASGCYIQRKRRRMRMVTMSNEVARQKQLVSVLPQGATYKGRGEGWGWGWWPCRMRSQGKNSWWVYCLRVLGTKDEDEDEDGGHV